MNQHIVVRDGKPFVRITIKYAALKLQPHSIISSWSSVQTQCKMANILGPYTTCKIAMLNLIAVVFPIAVINMGKIINLVITDLD